MDLNDEANQPQEGSEKQTPQTDMPNAVTFNPNPESINSPQNPSSSSRIEKLKHLISSLIENIKLNFLFFNVLNYFFQNSTSEINRSNKIIFLLLDLFNLHCFFI